MPTLKSVPYSKIARVFELDGWVFRHTRGDHLIYVKLGHKRPVVIPKWNEVPIFIIQTTFEPPG